MLNTNFVDGAPVWVDLGAPDVARAAGVSQGTASNVFNRPEIVRPEVRARVEASARRLGYAGPAPGERFLAEYGRVTAAVRQAFEDVVQ